MMNHHQKENKTKVKQKKQLYLGLRRIKKVPKSGSSGPNVQPVDCKWGQRKEIIVPTVDLNGVALFFVAYLAISTPREKKNINPYKFTFHYTKSNSIIFLLNFKNCYFYLTNYNKIH